MKKFLTALLAAAALFCAAAAGVSAETINPYSTVYTMSHDDSESALADGKITAITQADGGVSDFRPGGLVFRDVDFGKMTPKKIVLTAGLPLNHAGRIDFKLDKYDGEIFATVYMRDTGGWTIRQEFEGDILTDVSGVHDVWMVMSTGNGRLYSFEIIPEEYSRTPIVLGDGSGEYGDELSKEDEFYCRLIGGLGFTSSKDGKFDPGLTVSRGTFVSFIDWVLDYSKSGEKYFTDVADDHAYYEAIARLKKYNIIEGYGDMTFKPDRAITAEEAATICANALGYMKGTEYGHEEKKAELITKSGIKKSSAPLTTLSASKMLYRFLTSDYVSYKLKSSKGFISDDSKCILEETRDIYLKTGVVDGNVLGKIANPADSTDADEVTIDGISYKTLQSGAEQYLGRSCQFFVYEGEYDEILSIAPDKKSESITVTDAEEPYISGGYLYYTPDEKSSRTKKIKLPQTANVIYNSVSYENVDMAKLLDMQNLKYDGTKWISNGEPARAFKGSIELVDYSGGDEPDVIFVNYYENLVISGYDRSSKLIYDKLSDRSYYVTGEEEASYATLFLNGEAISYRDLAEDMAGVIYKSINNEGKTVVVAYFTDDSVSGRITAKTNDEIKIDGVKYDADPELLALGKIYIGLDSEFVLNPYNEVIWVLSGSADGSNDRIVTFIKGAYEDEAEAVVITVYDTAEAALKTYTANEKIWLEGVRVKSFDDIMNGTAEYTDIGVAALKRGYLMKLKLDADGKITYIDSQLEGAKNERDCVKMISSSLDGEQLIYRKSSYVFGTTSAGNKYPYNADATLISCPSPSSSEYKLGDGFDVSDISTLKQQDQARSFVLYSTEYGTSVASVVVYYTDTSTNYDTLNLWLFESVGDDVIGRNEEILKTVVLNLNGLSKTYTVTESCAASTDFAAFVPGTLMKVALNAHGEILSVKKMFVPGSTDGTVSDDNPESESTINSSTRTVWATVEERDGSFLKISKTKSGVKNYEYIYASGAGVFIFKNTANGVSVEKADAGAMIKGKKALFILDYGSVKQAIMYQ